MSNLVKRNILAACAFSLLLCCISCSANKKAALAPTKSEKAVKPSAAPQAKATKQSSGLSSPPTLTINHKNLPTVVWYYTDWCGYCNKMRPFISNAEKTYKGKVYFHKVDVEDPKNLTFVRRHRLQPGGIPYFQYYDKDGNYLVDTIGAVPEDTFNARLKAFFSL